MAKDFKSSFAAARKAGKKEFTWNGKSYNTELKETARPKARPQASPKVGTAPKPRPTTGGVLQPEPEVSNWQKLRNNIEASRREREKARDAKRKAKASKTDGIAAQLRGNVSSSSKGAVKKSMAKAAGANFR